MKRLFASSACLAIATALLAAPAVAQAPASPAQPAPAAAAPAAPAASQETPAAPGPAATMPMAHTHPAGSHAMTHTQRVERLQTALNANGAQLTVDGKMGPKTSAALTTFQQAHGLKVTGRIDKETMAALRKTS